ncbi:MAG: phosphotransferase [Anaerolineae bacterium]|nr:phosphotransferase [Anaerolineae bacterium]
MLQPNTLTDWTTSAWRDEALAWIDASLARLSRRRAGPVEQPHVRPWSTVISVPTDAGTVYFKAVGCMAAHEVALTVALARWRPDVMPPVLAANEARGWLLMPDGGPRLREIIRADRDLGHWERLLPLYAEAQMDLADRVTDLLSLGTPDRRLDRLPALYAALLADEGALRVGQEPGLTTGEYARLQADVPRFAALCEELAGHGIPASLHHGDFHDGNIFTRDGAYLFFDWGDSVVSHPFFSLRTVSVSLEMSLDLPENAPEFQRLVDAYLEPWTRAVPRSALRAAYPLAHRVGVINGALTWHAAVSALPEPLREEYAEPVPALLQEYLGLA